MAVKPVILALSKSGEPTAHAQVAIPCAWQLFHHQALTLSHRYRQKPPQLLGNERYHAMQQGCTRALSAALPNAPWGPARHSKSCSASWKPPTSSSKANTIQARVH